MEKPKSNSLTGALMGMALAALSSEGVELPPMEERKPKRFIEHKTPLNKQQKIRRRRAKAARKARQKNRS
ncbi:hypothetical protein ACE193_15390 [Bernardetia sp. OM2101]|uniref:hypothetical protein n=1 Tax=Bernardetia sp. OM2101 TaxID=3344876 RepID=UPI0035CECAEB